MKKKIISIIAIAAVFALAIAAFAYTQTNETASTTASCCKKDGDSCPMKAKGGHNENGEHASKSCPMKNHGGHDTMAATAEHTCCECCGDSCPMKKSEGAAAAASSTAEGHSCCGSCDCCKEKAGSTV